MTIVWPINPPLCHKTANKPPPGGGGSHLLLALSNCESRDVSLQRDVERLKRENGGAQKKKQKTTTKPASQKKTGAKRPGSPTKANATSKTKKPRGGPFGPMTGEFLRAAHEVLGDALPEAGTCCIAERLSLTPGYGKWRSFCNHLNGKNDKCYAASRDKTNRKAFCHIGDKTPAGPVPRQTKALTAKIADLANRYDVPKQPPTTTKMAKSNLKVRFVGADKSLDGGGRGGKHKRSHHDTPTKARRDRATAPAEDWPGPEWAEVKDLVCEYCPHKRLQNVEGDGNCLPRSLALVLLGDENRYDEIRQIIADTFEKDATGDHQFTASHGDGGHGRTLHARKSGQQLHATDHTQTRQTRDRHGQEPDRRSVVHARTVLVTS